VAERPITAFISWAHGDEAWAEVIAAFVFKLREYAIDAEVDLFHVDSQDVNWSTFGPRAIEDSDFVLLAVSPTYRERWDGRGDPRQGAGVAREAEVLKSLFDDDRDKFRRKVKVVLLPGARPDDIPRELRPSIKQFTIESFDLPGLTDRLRTLTQQPRWKRSELGEVPILPDNFARAPEGKEDDPDAAKRAIENRRDAVKQEIDAVGDDAVPEDLAQRLSVLEANEDDECADLEAEIQNARGRLLGDDALRTDPGSAVTLRTGGRYRVKISHP
jgi:hypothetical protein